MLFAKYVSLILILVIIFLSILLRKFIISFSSIGVFWVTQILFIYIGVCIFPWMEPYLGEGVFFSDFNFTFLSETDYIRAMLFNVGGGLVVIVVYILIRIATADGKIEIKNEILKSGVFTELGFNKSRVMILSLLFLALVLLFFLSNLAILKEGIYEGIIIANQGKIINARRLITNNYIVTLIIYNVLPFFSVALLFLYKYSKSKLLKVYYYTYAVITFISLLLVFQKRPLLVFLMALFLGNLWINYNDYYYMETENKKRGQIGSKFVKLIKYGTGLILILVIFYVIQLRLNFNESNVVNIISQYLMISLVRITGRISISAPIYLYYFPGIAPHYGFSNIGLFSNIFGINLYSDTSQIFKFISGETGGNVAVSAVIDFYGGFGVLGWLVGTIFLGIILERLDSYISKLEINPGKVLLMVFSYVFVLYLSQTSLPRSLMGYGGLIFVFLWALIRYPKFELKQKS